MNAFQQKQRWILPINLLSVPDFVKNIILNTAILVTYRHGQAHRLKVCIWGKMEEFADRSIGGMTQCWKISFNAFIELI